MKLLESKSKKSSIFIIIVLALVTMAPRVSSLHSHWTSSDEDWWIGKSFGFLVALHRGDFQETVSAYHPGVITMWVGAATLWPKYRNLLFMFDDEKQEVESAQALAIVSVENLRRTRFGIAILSTAAILMAFHLMRRLLGSKIALVASLLIAFDPTYLMETRRIHVDAPMTSFLVLTILSLIIYMEFPHKRGYLLFSGLTFGIACLSKAPSMILVLYLPLLFALYSGLQVSHGGPYSQYNTAGLLHSLLVWTGAACLVVIGLWPALWTAKIRLGVITFPILFVVIPPLIAITIWSYRQLVYRSAKSSYENIRNGRSRRLVITLLCFIGLCLVLVTVLTSTDRLIPEIREALATPHNFPQMFLGNVVYDPGVFFYPIMATIYATPSILILFVVGVIMIWARRDQIKNSKMSRVFLGLSIFIVLYITCMSLGAKKFSRYILPIYPIFDILAAMSLCALVELMRRRFGSGVVNKKYSSHLSLLGKPTTGFAIISAILLYQVLSTLSLHPHYGSYYNRLWPNQLITKTTLMGRGVGVEKAANYLNQKNREEDIIVRASFVGGDSLRHYFDGRMQPLDVLLPDNTNVYDFIYVHDVQLGAVDEKSYGNRMPEHTVTVNNIDFAKIYKAD